MKFRSRAALYALLLVVISLLLLSQPHDFAAPLQKAASTKSLSKDMIALIDAAGAGNTARVQALLDKGVSASTQVPNGLTPLIQAAMMNCPAVVNLLLDRGANVDAALVDDDYIGGSTALIMAADGAGNIMAGAKTPPSPKGYEGHETAFMKKHPDLMRQWEQQMNIWAKGYDQIVRLLIAHGANVNAQTSIGMTAIDCAATEGDLEMVQLLLDNGARLDLPTHEKDLIDGRSIDGTVGYEALTGATSMFQHNPKIIKLLLAHGAKPNAQSTNDLTALGRAAESGDVEVVQMLLDAGANVNAYDGFGRTALMLAKSNKHKDVVMLLYQSGAKDLPEGPHGTVTLKKLGHEPNGDTKLQVTVTPRPGGKPSGKK